MMRFKCVSINVCGLRSAYKRNLILHELEGLGCDAYLLQETHVSCKQQAEIFESRWRGQCLWSFGSGKSAGVAVLFSPNFVGNVRRFLFDTDGRILSILISFGSVLFNLVNVYAPNKGSERKTFFEQLHTFFISQGDYIIGGDFNCVDSVLE